jgi:hypothetical protein
MYVHLLLHMHAVGWHMPMYVHYLCVIDAGEPAEMHTVFQIAGPETPGLLAEITELLSHNGLEIRTAAVSAGCRQHSTAAGRSLSVISGGSPHQQVFRLAVLLACFSAYTHHAML